MLCCDVQHYMTWLYMPCLASVDIFTVFKWIRCSATKLRLIITRQGRAPSFAPHDDVIHFWLHLLLSHMITVCFTLGPTVIMVMVAPLDLTFIITITFF